MVDIAPKPASDVIGSGLVSRNRATNGWSGINEAMIRAVVHKTENLGLQDLIPHFCQVHIVQKCIARVGNTIC